ncbi:MAG: hypothetical protein IH611_11885, partial [Deltaproteobacteria bacterium]|nr:hypothetical protein [Deltaproteobacteria bacterium]
TAIRGSGAIVSATLSLGYDVHHSRVEGLLVTAAKESGLEEPFVQILEMGNFTITYRISGVLTEVKWLITARTNLSRSVLDVLHRDGVEIMSPDFRNLRMLPEDRKIVPVTVQEMSSEKPVVVEDIVFDKAEQAEQIYNESRELVGKIEEMELMLKEASGEEEERTRKRIEEARERLEVLEQKAGELGLEDHAHESAARGHADKPRS